MNNCQKIFLLTIIVLGACYNPPNDEPTTAQDSRSLTPSRSVSIMTFNVENLFDNRDDPGKDDQTYLPAAVKSSDEHVAACNRISVQHWRDQCLHWDWSDAMLKRKLAAISQAILAVNDGKGPDIIALQEIENIEILERLRNDYLADAGYLPAILIEGHDIRGIDVAFLTRLAVVGEPALHRFPDHGVDEARFGDTRGILEVLFQLPDGAQLTGFAVHFPAPFHPTPMREIAYAQLNALQAALPADRYAFAAGDFNTTSKEDREQDMLGRLARPTWTIAHETGCADCRGTQYYPPDDSWSFLDMILWAPARERGADATWQIRAASVTVANKGPGQTSDSGTPQRFELPEGRGVSDHWPLLLELELN